MTTLRTPALEHEIKQFDRNRDLNQLNSNQMTLITNNFKSSKILFLITKNVHTVPEYKALNHIFFFQ